MEDFEKELKFDFLEEATQLLESTEQAFLQLEDDFEDKNLINEIFRFAHNLKGTSRAVGFGVVAEFTHEVEDLILKIKQEEVQINQAVVSVLLECNDHIALMISELKEDFDKTFSNDPLLEKVKKAIAGDLEVPNEETQDSEPQDFAVDEELINHDLLAELEEQERLRISAREGTSEVQTEAPVESVEVGKTPVQVAPPTSSEDNNLPGLNVFEGKDNITNINETKKKTPKKEEKKADPDETIRVSLARVEILNNFVGELVILQSVLEQQKYTRIKDELAIKSVSQLNKLCKEIQEISMSLRMIPIKSTLQKMTRIVRDTSKALDKKVTLTLKGEETEIDKTVLELIADPLVHIVRNAVDHGLEETADREGLGKEAKGNVTIEAFHEGNNLVIEVRDDGKGIDPEVIKRKAVEKGLLHSGTNISDKDVIQYIFHAGFSTKEEVSEVSGRGVGMDVVKTNIEKLSGDVRVDTVLGIGSTFKIVLPLTMAIIDGLIIRVGSEKFVLPITQVQESLKPLEDDIHFTTGLGHCLDLRGHVLPVKSLSSLLKLGGEKKDVKDQIVIIINGKKGAVAIAVDDIIQQQQVVIKKLGSEITNQKGFMGSSILGDGKPAFIIDVDDLCSTNQSNSKATEKKAA